MKPELRIQPGFRLLPTELALPIRAKRRVPLLSTILSRQRERQQARDSFFATFSYFLLSAFRIPQPSFETWPASKRQRPPSLMNVSVN